MNLARRIAVLGIGIMGEPMARNLARAGHSVVCWNRSREKTTRLAAEGLAVADSPAAAAAGADFIVVMVSDGNIADQILFHGDEATVLGAEAGTCVIMMSSIAVETSREQSRRLAELGIAYVDAPVSGGEKGAIEATLSIMAGGSHADVSAARPVLEAMGRVTHVGPVGAGQLCKLANQLIVGVTIGAVAEGLALVAAGGGDPRGAWTALQGGFADSTILRQHGQRILDRRFDPGARSSIQLKDLNMIVAQARGTGLHLEHAELARDEYEDLCARGHGDLDHAALWLRIMGEPDR
ncbi:NAD(P)-dependent oxidoreductase [Novosphingobium mathurense]|uniref:2-hydroxy-3-oxopropionate reductase n=1 Tax=Novosphingobium mathurense TaxID=428990 RepID=A0A1U6IIS3_9SPHN|nr:NAD(P)-dependent oxidoreductase [Novosphingobium mathurense]SLK07900.1 2-hydroxy-3-oxopropionate reductase [Novosphingobium mathurense]